MLVPSDGKVQSRPNPSQPREVRPPSRALAACQRPERKVLLLDGIVRQTKNRCNLLKISERAYKPDSVFTAESHRGMKPRRRAQSRRRSFLWAADRSAARC